MQKLLQKLERFSQALLAPLSYLTAAGLLLAKKHSGVVLGGVFGVTLMLSLIHI